MLVMTKQVNILLTEEQVERLKVIGQKRQRTVSWIVRDLVDQYLREKATVVPTPAPEVFTQPKSLDELYDLLEPTQPGSEQSLRISEQIIDATGCNQLKLIGGLSKHQLKQDVSPCITVPGAEDEDLPIVRKSAPAVFLPPATIFCLEHPDGCLRTCDHCIKLGAQCIRCASAG